MKEEDKKKMYSYVTEYQKEKYDRVSVWAAKGSKERWKKYANKAGMSLTAYVEEAVEEKIQRDFAEEAIQEKKQRDIDNT